MEGGRTGLRLDVARRNEPSGDARAEHLRHSWPDQSDRVGVHGISILTAKAFLVMNFFSGSYFDQIKRGGLRQALALP